MPISTRSRTAAAAAAGGSSGTQTGAAPVPTPTAPTPAPALARAPAPAPASVLAGVPMPDSNIDSLLKGHTARISELHAALSHPAYIMTPYERNVMHSTLMWHVHAIRNLLAQIDRQYAAAASALGLHYPSPTQQQQHAHASSLVEKLDQMHATTQRRQEALESAASGEQQDESALPAWPEFDHFADVLNLRTRPGVRVFPSVADPTQEPYSKYE